eukprot:5518921-Pleurochrysis_carterae.AAC.1
MGAKGTENDFEWDRTRQERPGRGQEARKGEKGKEEGVKGGVLRSGGDSSPRKGRVASDDARRRSSGGCRVRVRAVCVACVRARRHHAGVA